MMEEAEQIDNKDNWDQHWSNFTTYSSYNPAQDYRRTLIIKQLKLLNQSQNKILDIGSGQGDLAKELIISFPKAKIFGFELSEVGVEIAKKTVLNAKFFNMDLTIPIQNIPSDLINGVNIVICSEVLEHIDDPVSFLKNAAAVFNKDCYLIVTVPAGPRSAYDIHIGHRKHFTSKELEALLEETGFKVDYVLKAGFPFFNLYKLLVVLRGKKLITDSSKNQLSFLSRCVMHFFSFLFKMNLSSSLWGWQLLAVARYKG